MGGGITMLYEYLIYRYNVNTHKEDIVAVSDFEEEANKILDLFATQSFCKGTGDIYSVAKLEKKLYKDYDKTTPKRILVEIREMNLMNPKNYSVTELEDSFTSPVPPCIQVLLNGPYSSDNYVSMKFTLALNEDDRISNIVKRIKNKFDLYMNLIRRYDLGFYSLDLLKTCKAENLKHMGFKGEGKCYTLFFEDMCKGEPYEYEIG